MRPHDRLTTQSPSRLKRIVDRIRVALEYRLQYHPRAVLDIALQINLLQAQTYALGQLLIEKGVCTQAEIEAHMLMELEIIAGGYEALTATED